MMQFFVKALVVLGALALFAEIKKSSDNNVFKCARCQIKDHHSEIDLLKDAVKKLSQEVDALKGIQNSHATVSTSPQRLTKDNLAPPSNLNKVANSTHQNQPDKGILPKPAQNNSVQVDRKYNLVLYGIGESLKDTPRLQRVEHDLGHQWYQPLTQLPSKTSTEWASSILINLNLDPYF